MAGCRPLTGEERARALARLGAVEGPLAARNLALVVLGYTTGLRARSLLSVRVGDVVQDGRIRETLEVRAAYTKSRRAHEAEIVEPAAWALALWIARLREWGLDARDRPLWVTGPSGAPLAYHGYWRLWRALKRDLALGGKVATHSGRKTCADLVDEASGGDVRIVQDVLGHTDLRNTQRYLAALHAARARRIVRSIEWAA